MARTTPNSLLLALTTGMIGLTGVALAADSAPPPAFQAVLACRAQSDNAARLKCFDDAVASLGAAQSKGEVIVVDKAEVSKARREAFGLTLPNLSFFKTESKDEAFETMTSTVKSARRASTGPWTMTLENGSVWRQITNDDITVKPGVEVRIRKGAIGSFLMNVGKQPAIKVHRDE